MSFGRNGFAKKIDVKIANPRNSTSPNAKAFQERVADFEDGHDFFTLHQIDQQDSINRKDRGTPGSSSQKKTAPRGHIKAKPHNLSSAQKPGLNIYRHGAQMAGDLAKEDYLSSNSQSYRDFRGPTLSDK